MTGFLNPTVHARVHVEECRAGNYMGLGCIRIGLENRLYDLDEIGIRDGEFITFTRGAIEIGKRYAEEVLAGNDENFSTLVQMVGLQIVFLQDLPIHRATLNQLMMTRGYNHIFTEHQTV